MPSSFDGTPARRPAASDPGVVLSGHVSDLAHTIAAVHQRVTLPVLGKLCDRMRLWSAPRGDAELAFECPDCHAPRGDATCSASPDALTGIRWICINCRNGGTPLDLVMAAQHEKRDAALEWLKTNVTAALKEVRPPRPSAPQVDVERLWSELVEYDERGALYLASRTLGEAVARRLVRFNTGATHHAWTNELFHKGYVLALPMRDGQGAIRSIQFRQVIPPSDPRYERKKNKFTLLGTEPARLRCYLGAPHDAAAATAVYISEGIADTLALQSTGVVAVGVPGHDMLPRMAPALG
jgi:hypothetical protein